MGEYNHKNLAVQLALIFNAVKNRADADRRQEESSFCESN